MDHQITYSFTSSSSSSSSNNHPPTTTKPSRPTYLDSLHSVRKRPVQKPITKHFIAPLPPAPSKVYQVESSNFKEVVRMLTSTPEFQYPSVRRLKDIAPPPLTLSSIPKPSIFTKPPVIPPPQPQPPPPQPSSESDDQGTVNSPLSFTLSPGFCKFLNETLETSRFVSKATPVMDCFGSLSPLRSPAPQAYDPLGVGLMSPLGFGLSPSSLSWCSSALLSPVSLSVFN